MSTVRAYGIGRVQMRSFSAAAQGYEPVARRAREPEGAIARPCVRGNNYDEGSTMLAAGIGNIGIVGIVVIVLIVLAVLAFMRRA
jgi:uncharacterized membrane protein